jgi:hypothetical protein
MARRPNPELVEQLGGLPRLGRVRDLGTAGRAAVAALVGRDHAPPAREQASQLDEIVDPATAAMKHEEVSPAALDPDVERRTELG